MTEKPFLAPFLQGKPFYFRNAKLIFFMWAHIPYMYFCVFVRPFPLPLILNFKEVMVVGVFIFVCTTTGKNKLGCYGVQLGGGGGVKGMLSLRHP